MLTVIVAIISQYMYTLDQYVVHLKLTVLSDNYIPIKK